MKWPLQITIPLPYRMEQGSRRSALHTYGVNWKVTCNEKERDEVLKAAETLGLTPTMFCRTASYEAAKAVNNLTEGDDNGTRLETEGSSRKVYE